MPVPGVTNGGTLLNTPASLPASEEMATIDASGNISTQAIPSGGVTGPVSSTVGAVALWGDTTGDSLLSQLNLLVESGLIKFVQTGGTAATNATHFDQTATNLDVYPKNGGCRFISPNNNVTQLIGGFYANNLTQGVAFYYNGVDNAGGHLRLQGSGQPLGVYEGAPSGQLHVQSASSSRVATKITGASGQTANLLELSVNNGSALASISASGRGTFPSIVVGGGTACDGIRTAAASLDFGSIGANSMAELTISVTGASVGDAVFLGPPSTIEADVIAFGYVSATDTVTIRAHTASSGSVDQAAATWRVVVLSF